VLLRQLHVQTQQYAEDTFRSPLETAGGVGQFLPLAHRQCSWLVSQHLNAHVIRTRI
jgi:hypothetical protein